MIAVAGALAGLLVPAVAGSRRAARKLVCQSNLRQLGTMHLAYSAGNDEWLAGSPLTSGWDAIGGPSWERAGSPRRSMPVVGNPLASPVGVRDRLGIDPETKAFNGVAMQAWDWLGPLAEAAGLGGPGSSHRPLEGDHADALRAQRLEWYRSDLDFARCPENGFDSLPYTGKYADVTRDQTGQTGETIGPFERGPMLSYDMSTQFTSTSDDVPFGTKPRGNFRRGYTPRADRVGPSSMKALLFEGHRYARKTQRPDHDIDIDGHYGGPFGDTGPWFRRSKALDRSLAEGEAERDLWQGNATLRKLWKDWRPVAFRHGEGFDNNWTVDGVLGNVSFFDGHVEQMDDLEATDPFMWFPRGTRLHDPLEFWPSTVARFPGRTVEGTEVP